MARVTLNVSDDAVRITVKTLLEADGHRVVPAEGEVLVCDHAPTAASAAARGPVLLLTVVHDLPAAVQAMRRGVFGYVILPLVAGELGLMVQRAVASSTPTAMQAAPARDGARPLEAVEREHILAVLRACKQNQAEAARRLGIGRNTLWRKLKRMRAETAPQS